MSSAPVYVGVCGAGRASAEVDEWAVEVGRLLGAAGAVVVCGGRGGVMESVARGASSCGGTVVGLLPGSSREEGNEYLSVVIPTGLGEMRNALIIRASDVVIAIGGEWGTLSEIALARKAGVPVVGLGTWELPELEVASSPADAVSRALALVG